MADGFLLTKYGLREWGIATVVAAVVVAVLALLGWWWLVAVALVLWVALLLFFRDPIRRLPGNLASGAMLSPADGVVSAVTRVDHHDAAGGPAVVIRIFLSVLNVHVNRFRATARSSGSRTNGAASMTPGRLSARSRTSQTCSR